MIWSGSCVVKTPWAEYEGGGGESRVVLITRAGVGEAFSRK